MVESGPEQAWIDRPGGVFLRRADLMPPEDRTAAARDGARGDGRRRGRARTSSWCGPPVPFGRLPDDMPRHARRPAARSRRSSLAAPAPASKRSTASAASPTAAREYVIRVHGNRGSCPAGALGQRRRPSDVRLRGVGPEHRLHVVGEQPRQPPDAVAQRSGQRSARRSGLPARRTERTRSGRRRRCPPAAGSRTRSGTATVTAPTSTLATASIRAARLRCRRRAGQGLPACACATPRTGAGSFR